MRTKSPSPKAPAERVLKDIRRATRKHYSAEDKIRIVLDGLRGAYVDGAVAQSRNCNSTPRPVMHCYSTNPFTSNTGSATLPIVPLPVPAVSPQLRACSGHNLPEE